TTTIRVRNALCSARSREEARTASSSAPEAVGKTDAREEPRPPGGSGRPLRRFLTGADLELLSMGQGTPRALERRLRGYTRPHLLAIDEVGYLAYDAPRRRSPCFRW